MKIAFALLPEKGHVNPYIGPAQALVELGHEVVVGAPGDISSQVERAGLRFSHDLVRPPAPDQRVTQGQELVELIQDAARLDHWIEQLLLDGVDQQAPMLRDWYRHEHADVVVIDPLYYAAAIGAHAAGLPWASVSNSLNPVIPPDLDSVLLRTVKRLAPRRDELFHRHGLTDARFSGCDVLSPYLTVAFATEAFTGPAPPGVELPGPSLPLWDRGDETALLRPRAQDRPILYVSFGSQIYYWPAIFEKLRAAGEQLGAHCVFSMGGLAEDRSTLTGASASFLHTDVYQYAPQLEILRQASIFVTHGGANSVMEAIAAGVPLLISPMCNDQFHQAYFVARTGIGIVEDLTQAPVGRIVEHLKHLLQPNPALQAISRTYGVNDGARRTAVRIAALQTTR